MIGCRSFVLAGSLLLAHASAAPELSAQARAVVDVPPNCGSDVELRSELVRLLGADAADDALPERLSITRREDGSYALALELRHESRTLTDPDCRALFKTAVIVAAATIDPTLAPTKTPAPAPESESEPPSPPLPIHADFALGAGASLGLLPEVAPLLALSATFTLGPFGVGVAGRYLFGAEEHSDPTHGVDVHGFGGRLTLVYDPFQYLRLQAGASLDSLIGRGLGPGVAEQSGSGAALALLLELSAVPIRFGQLFVSIGISGQYAVVRPSFEITGYREVYRVPRLGGTGIVSVGWQFL